MSSPFDAAFLILATSGSVAAVRWLTPICLDVYKAIRDNSKIEAETKKVEAEAYKALAEGRKADAEARKTDAETEEVLRGSNLALRQESQSTSLTVEPRDTEFALDRAKELSQEISKNLTLDKMTGDLEERLMDFLPDQARAPLRRAITDITKSSFVIVRVEVSAIQISEDEARNHEK